MESQGTIRTETAAGVRSIILSRPEQNNSLTLSMRDALAHAVDAADTDPEVRVILLRADGPSFCGGWGLDWNTRRQAEAAATGQVWDSIADFGYISQHHDMYMKFWYARKPTIAAGRVGASQEARTSCSARTSSSRRRTPPSAIRLRGSGVHP